MSQLWILSNFGGTASSPLNPSQCLRSSELGHRYPETWRINEISDYEKIPLRCEDKEFPLVYSYFHQTMPESQYIIQEISRIQNYFQWERYTRKRDHMVQKLSELEWNRLELDLFHGTDFSMVEAICRQNFDPRVSGKHGTVYGKGCYFAKKADYSHKFSTATSDGHHYMFLAKVLVGRPALGSPSFRRPPPVYSGDPASPLYNSCVSRLNDPEIFVIFESDQCYPNFVIKYQKVQDMVIVV
ncbi:hypothetical protein FKM82_028772 [Ascaphus truei]